MHNLITQSLATICASHRYLIFSREPLVCSRYSRLLLMNRVFVEGAAEFLKVAIHDGLAQICGHQGDAGELLKDRWTEQTMHFQFVGITALEGDKLLSVYVQVPVGTDQTRGEIGERLMDFVLSQPVEHQLQLSMIACFQDAIPLAVARQGSRNRLVNSVVMVFQAKLTMISDVRCLIDEQMPVASAMPIVGAKKPAWVRNSRSPVSSR